MDILKKITRKNLKLNKKRTLFTMIGIMLSSALVSFVFSMAICLRESLVDYYKVNNGDFHYLFYDVPAKDIEQFENNRKVESYFTIKDFGCAALPQSANSNKSYLNVIAATGRAMDGLHFELLSGRLPQREDEIVIPKHLRTDAKVVYHVGDTVTFSLGERVSEGVALGRYDIYNGGTIEHAKEMTYKIVGEIERPPRWIEEANSVVYTLVTYTPEEQMGSGKYSIYARYTPKALRERNRVTSALLGMDSDFLDATEGGFSLGGKWDTVDKLEAEQEKQAYMWNVNDSLVKMEAWEFNSGFLEMITILVVIVALIILVVSVFCIRNSFDISITEKIRQYGMLASVGATRKQIRKNVYQEAAALGMAAIPAGVLFGDGVSVVLVKIADRLLRDAFGLSISYYFSVFPLAAAILLGVVTVFLSARHGAGRAAKISPISAIRETQDIFISRRKIRSPKAIGKWFGAGGEIAYKNMKRNRKKYRTIVISIVVCVSSFISLASTIKMARISMEMQFNAKDYELQVNVADARLEKEEDNRAYEQAVKKLGSLDGIDAYSNIRGLRFTIKNAKYTSEAKKYKKILGEDEEFDYTPRLIALGDAEYKRYLGELGLSFEDVKNQAVLINGQRMSYYDDEKEMAIRVDYELYSYKEGDRVQAVFRKGGKKAELGEGFSVAAVTDKRPLGIGDSYESEGYFVVSDERMDQLLQEKELLKLLNWRKIAIQTSCADEVQEKLDTVLGDFRYDVENFARDVRREMSLVTLIEIFMYGFIIVVAFIGITSIFNTVTTNMELRSKEFAMLKSIGMTKREFNRMVGLESLFYSMKALAIGIPIGIILSGFIYSQMMSGGYYFRYVVPFGAIFVSVLGVFGLLFLIAHYSLKRIGRHGIIDVIRNENI